MKTAKKVETTRNGLGAGDLCVYAGKIVIVDRVVDETHAFLIIDGAELQVHIKFFSPEA